MRHVWLLKRLVYLGSLVLIGLSFVTTLVLGRNSVAAILDGSWPPWVSNLANVFQIGGPIVALAWWGTRAARAHRTRRDESAAVCLLRLLALLLPPRDRERFVREVMANMADRQRWWQRVEELLWVAAAVPGLAVILRWARRRGA